MAFEPPQFEEMAQMRKEQKLEFKVSVSRHLHGLEIQELDATKEYAEMHYFTSKHRSEHETLIQPSKFWSELAMHLCGKLSFSNFLSTYFVTSTTNFSELIFTLSLMDLPFVEESHGLKSEKGRRVEIKAASNTMIFMKEIAQTKKSHNRNLLVVHRYLEKDKTEETKEFLINQVYTC